MNRNYELIIDYIYDNIIYGSKIMLDDLLKLFSKYEIKYEFRTDILYELESLKIKIELYDGICIYNLHEFFSMIDYKNQINEDKLEKYLQGIKVDNEIKEKFKFMLLKLGYKIIAIHNEVKEDDLSSLDFLDDLDNYYIDQLFDSEEFQNEVLKLQDPIDYSYNLDYLEEIKSAEEFKQNRNALENLVKANSGLVEKIASKYAFYASSSYEYEDMVQDGFRGLIKAAEKFDFSYKTKFSTYAVWWIRQSIRREIINVASSIRLPVYMFEQVNKYNRSRTRLFNYKGEEPSDVEISEEMGISIEKLKDIKRAAYLSNIYCIDSPVDEDSDTTHGQLIPSEEESIEDIVERKELLYEIEKLISSILNEREQFIIKERFGFYTYNAKTLEEIGDDLGITRERVRQIEKKVLNKIRKSKLGKRLNAFIYD